MNLKYSELREKDVIDVCGGRRVGYLCDLAFEADCGRITAIYVSTRIFGGGGSVCIPWEEIVCIGEDAILVKAERVGKPENGKGSGKHRFFG